MTDTENNKNSNSPVLRFPGFTEPWKKCRLGDYIRIFSGESPNCVSSKFGIIPYYKVEQLNWCEKYLGETPYLSQRGKNILPEGCVVFSKRGAAILTNKVRMNLFPINIDTNLMGIKADNSFISDQYLFYFILRARLSRIADTSTIPQINNIHINPITIHVPSLEEQEKITRSLGLLDERIATQRRLIEDLEKLKSSIVEEVYCSPRENVPRQRINKKYVDNWSVCQLGDICTRITRRNTTIESNRILTIAAQYGLIDQCSFFNKVVASENLSNYYILKKGDFAYNKSYSGDYIWGAVKRLDKYESGVLSPLYICFQPKEKLIDSDYLLFYFESKKWHKDIAEIVVEGARNHGLLNVSIKDFFNMLIPLPSLDEQRDIAATIRAVLIKIECERTILQRYESQKGYLLSKMLI
ncbi:MULTISPECIES: restriction endonuclease subunit S [Muribaculaceae]|nr:MULTISPECIES: restriction endonuclease subunit S [Muribaculaceae]